MKPLLHLLHLLALVAVAAVLLAMLEAPPVARLLASAPDPDDDGDDDEDTDIYEPDLGDPGAHRPTVRKAVNR